jgi:hypothetical protein
VGALSLEELANQVEVDAEYVRQLAELGAFGALATSDRYEPSTPSRNLIKIPRGAVYGCPLPGCGKRGTDHRHESKTGDCRHDADPIDRSSGVVKPKRSPAATTMAIPKTKK